MKKYVVYCLTAGKARSCPHDASVAQLAEQRIRNAQVAGSIPAGSSITKNR